MGACEHLDLRRNRTLGELFVAHPEPGLVGEQDFDASAASRNENHTVAFPRLYASNAALTEQARMALAKINAPKSYENATNKKRIQHEMSTWRSSGDKADTGTSAVTFPEAKRKVRV